VTPPPRLRRTLAGPAAALALASAGPVLAAPQPTSTPTVTSTATPQPTSAATRSGAEPPARLDLSHLAARFEPGQALKAAGIARTAVDRSFEGGGAASVGFLCGLEPAEQTSGAASAFGRDHDGRFLGAQLRLGFR
jgi:hypothetical protein